MDRDRPRPPLGGDRRPLDALAALDALAVLAAFATANSSVSLTDLTIPAGALVTAESSTEIAPAPAPRPRKGGRGGSWRGCGRCCGGCGCSGVPVLMGGPFVGTLGTFRGNGPRVASTVLKTVLVPLAPLDDV